MSSEHSASPPLFVLSCARSGSTLLRYILDTHPHVCCPGELSLGELCERLYWAVHDTTGQVAHGRDERARSQFALAEVRRVVSGLMDSYAATKGKRVWCEKTPLNLLHTGVLLETFPEARFICLYRDCMDVVDSCLEFSRAKYVAEFAPYFQQHPDDPASAMIAYWVDRTRMLLSFEQEHCARCFRLKYEELVTSPAASLEPMFHFIGEEWNARLLDSVFITPHDEGDGDPKILNTSGIVKGSVGKRLAVRPEQVPGELLRRANTLLRRLGYPEVGARADSPR
jgi:protein-tyrosine sulfotransferase